MKISKVISTHVYFLQERQFPHRQGLIWEGQRASHFTEFIYKISPSKMYPLLFVHSFNSPWSHISRSLSCA